MNAHTSLTVDSGPDPASGSIQSINPIYYSKQLICRCDITGKWRMNNGDYWEFKVMSSIKYLVTITTGFEKRNFAGSLVAIGNSYFLDLHPIISVVCDSYLFRYELFGRIEINNNHLSFFQMDWDRIAREFICGRSNVSFELDQETGLLLTDTTKNFQEFLLMYDRKNIYAGECRLTRMRK